MGPKTFQHRPLIVTAMQVTGEQEQAKDILVWVDALTHGTVLAVPRKDDGKYTVVIETLNGAVAADPEDWIVRDHVGDFDVYTDEAFRKTFAQQPAISEILGNA